LTLSALTDKMNKQKIFLLVSVTLILSLLVTSASAFEIKEVFTGKFWKDLGTGTWDTTKKVIGAEEPEKGDKIFGLAIPSAGSWSDFFYNFGIGIWAGIWIWIIASIQSWWRSFYAKAMAKENRRNPFATIRSHWLQLIAGRLWKVLIIAAGFAVLTQIPIINRFVQLITFGFYLDFWARTAVLALELGFIPLIVEHYMKIRLESKYKKMVTHAAKVGAQIEKEK